MAGRTIGERYVLEQPLGGGAMSSVWRARDDELERDVAVKLLAPAADRARFAREARAVAGLAHPNICQLYDYGESEQEPYMILEYLPGGTLEDRLAAGRPLPDEDAAGIAAEVAAALAYAHERGVVHRDLKPANILFDIEGRAKIADWGIARIAGGESLTETGTVLGTAAYISPEQAAGREATPASDVYSFGAILYRMLTGRPPFASHSALELVRMHQEDEPTPVAQLRPDAPTALAAAATAALAKDPARRPRDGGVLATALAGNETATTVLAPAAAGAAGETALLGDAFSAPPTQVLPRVRSRRRRPAGTPLLAAALLVLLGGGVAAAVLVTQSGSSTPPPTGTVTLPAISATGSSSSFTTASTTAPAPPPTTTPTETRTTSSTEPTSTLSTTHRTSTAAFTTTIPATTAPLPPPPPTTTAIPSSTADTTLPPTTTAPPTTTGP